MKRHILSLLLAAFLLHPQFLWAHCDTYEGPVVKAAERALERDDVNLVLIWVPRKDEAQIRKAFAAARESGAAQPFFETLVKVHREGEGVKFTGLKPRGTPVAPEIAAADLAITQGKLDPVLRYVPAGHRGHVKHAFAEVMKTKDYASKDVEAGRRYVEAYVKFVHLIEGHH